MLIDDAKYAFAKEVVHATKKYLKNGHKAFLRSLLFKAIMNEHIARPTSKTEKFLRCLIANTPGCKRKILVSTECENFKFTEMAVVFNPVMPYSEPAQMTIIWDL